MEYRTLPHGGDKISIVGLGMGSIHNSSTPEVERIVRAALDAGVNYFDFVPSKAVAFEGYARALKGQRDRAMLQVHIGDDMAARHYEQLKRHASDCVHCGHCDTRCPFGVHQSDRMAEIARHFGF